MKVVAVSGMIGTGKTTLCSALSKMTGWQIVRENPEANPFLPLFYRDMERWALPSQLTFMLHKTLDFERKIGLAGDVILVDRTLNEDMFVFSSVLKRYGILTKDELALIEEYYWQLAKRWTPIDLSIYLEDSDENCFQRVLERGSAYEAKIEIGYIRNIGSEYRKWRNEHLQTPWYELHPARLDFRHLENLGPVVESIRAFLESHQR
jgi:deoxyadenosine/deoxycytidine kinase